MAIEQAAPTQRETRMSRRRARAQAFRSDIQGLRAIAVAAVVLYHAGVPGLGGGYVGVDVFFVISGFLITSHLLREYATTATLRLGQFYGRRIRRLLPASFLVFVVSVVMCRVLLPPLEFADAAKAARWTALYVVNMLLAHTKTEYLSNAAPSPFQHYWSLGVEEQFYLIWPLLLLITLRLAHGRAKRIVLPMAVLAVASFLLCVWLTSYREWWAFFTLPTRAWEFGLGALVALSVGALARIPDRVAVAMTWLGVAAIIGAVVAFDATTEFPGAAAALPVVGTALVIAGGRPGLSGSADLILRRWPFQFIGGISYSLYLWHWPLLTIPAIDRNHPLSAATRAGLLVLAVVLAWLTKKFVEDYFKTASFLTGRVRKPMALLVVATVISLIGSAALAKLPTLHTNTALPAWPAAFSQPPAPTVVGRNLTPSLTAAGGDQPTEFPNSCLASFGVTSATPCIGGDRQSSVNVVLFGDSHAAQWSNAIDAAAQADRLKLEVLTKSSCPPMRVEVYNTHLGRSYTECDRWRSDALNEIGRMNPSVIVISHFLGEQLLNQADADQQWVSATKDLLGELPRSARVVMLGDDPNWRYSPLACLSKHLSDAAACSSPAAAVIPLQHSAVEQAAVTSSGGTFVDTQAWTCPGGQCPAVMWNVPVYRDPNHLTATFVSHFTPQLTALLKAG